MTTNGHNPKEFDAGADRDRNMADREKLCGNRIPGTDHRCLLNAKHGGRCLPIEPKADAPTTPTTETGEG